MVAASLSLVMRDRLPLARRRWVLSLPEDDRRLLDSLIEHYGPQLLTHARRFASLKEEYEYARDL